MLTQEQTPDLPGYDGRPSFGPLLHTHLSLSQRRQPINSGNQQQQAAAQLGDFNSRMKRQRGIEIAGAFDCYSMSASQQVK